MKTVISASFAVALILATAPAFAASFYVVQDNASKKCSVSETMPTATTTSIIGEKTGYKTHVDADAAMGKDTVCTTK